VKDEKSRWKRTGVKTGNPKLDATSKAKELGSGI
jgi:hypothetical protein